MKKFVFEALQLNERPMKPRSTNAATFVEDAGRNA
jgi:hypothetical protein